jgi:hypothetical protein
VCLGTWLSFAVRRVVLGFNDLALLEEDRLNPNGRILIVVGLTIIVGMFIKSGIISITLGGSPISLSGGLIAFLVGTLCGMLKEDWPLPSGEKARISSDLLRLAAGTSTR